MKVSVSLSARDVDFLDQLVSDGAYPTRSAAIAASVRVLRNRDLQAQYAEAYREWEASGDAAVWEVTGGDGIEAEEPWW